MNRDEIDQLAERYRTLRESDPVAAARLLFGDPNTYAAVTQPVAEAAPPAPSEPSAETLEHQRMHAELKARGEHAEAARYAVQNLRHVFPDRPHVTNTKG